MTDETQTKILVTQQVIVTEIGHIKQLLEKQNGRVGKLEDRCKTIEDRVTNTEKDGIKQKAWFGGMAAGIGAVVAIGAEKVTKFFQGLAV